MYIFMFFNTKIIEFSALKNSRFDCGLGKLEIHTLKHLFCKVDWWPLTISACYFTFLCFSLFLLLYLVVCELVQRFN